MSPLSIIMARENITRENARPLWNTYHGIIIAETNLPITSAPKDMVPRFIKILPIFSICFAVNFTIILTYHGLTEKSIRL